MTYKINYVDLIKEQFNLEPTTYFVAPKGTRLTEVHCKDFLHNVNRTEISIKKSQTTHVFNLTGMVPLITVALFCTPKKECKIKSISIRSKRDLFDPITGILEAARYALRHLKGREVVQVKNPSSVRTLITCCMNMTAHSIRNPKLDLFELSLLQTKKSLIEEIQEGRVIRGYRDFDTRGIYFENAIIHERENDIFRILGCHPKTASISIPFGSLI